MQNERESALERRLVREVKAIGGVAPKWTSPGNRGVPDRLVILPGGRTVYVEMKAPGEPLKPLQRKWAKTLGGLGHRHFKIDSVADIELFIREMSKGEI
ncbi:VRR-NUC domain-containing protein [Gorillibacterium sp. sgz500922]|uniref:VRR-NUC domain-containing protein n=1 Tax=Gorillibacterium sp. sgz500922 TaxID=3446694 RepID=UPI003F670ACD